MYSNPSNTSTSPYLVSAKVQKNMEYPNVRSNFPSTISLCEPAEPSENLLIVKNKILIKSSLLLMLFALIYY